MYETWVLWSVLQGPPAECNIPGFGECNTLLHSAYTRGDVITRGNVLKNLEICFEVFWYIPRSIRQANTIMHNASQVGLGETSGVFYILMINHVAKTISLIKKSDSVRSPITAALPAVIWL